MMKQRHEERREKEEMTSLASVLAIDERERAEQSEGRDSPDFCVVARAILQALMAFIPVSVSGHVSAATAVARTHEAA